MNIDYKKCRTTVHEKFMDNNSPVLVDFVWGESKRVIFCDSIAEMNTKIKELGWRCPKNMSLCYDRIIITFEKDSILPFKILANLELTNWEHDETAALVKLNEKNMVLHVYNRFINLSNEEIKFIIKDAKEANKRFTEQLHHSTKEEWLLHNYLYKGNVHTYTDSIA